MNDLLKLNDYLEHAPVGVVAMAFAIFLGYVLKTAQFFNNRYIPAVVVPVTAIGYTLLQICGHLLKPGEHHPWLYVTLNFMVGFVYGAIAWLMHAQILRRFVDPKLFNDDGSTKFFPKPTSSEVPKQEPQEQTKQ